MEQMAATPVGARDVPARGSSWVEYLSWLSKGSSRADAIEKSGMSSTRYGLIRNEPGMAELERQTILAGDLQGKDADDIRRSIVASNATLAVLEQRRLMTESKDDSVRARMVDSALDRRPETAKIGSSLSNSVPVQVSLSAAIQVIIAKDD